MASVNKREWTAPTGEKKQAWEVRYLLLGKHKSKSFRLKKEADAFKRRVEDDLANGNNMVLHEAVTVRRACEEWLRAAEDRLRAGQVGRSSMANYRKAVDLHIVPHLGKMKIDDVKSIHVEDLFRKLMRQSKLSPLTARSQIFYFKQVCDFAVRRGYLRKDPVGPAMKEMRGLKPPKVRTFTIEQVREVLKVAEKPLPGQHGITFLRVKCIVHLAAFCGLRWGEIVGMTLASVDLEKGMIRVRTALSRFDELKGPKTQAGIRDVPMPPHLADMLRQWVDRYYVENERALIFRTDTGFQIRPSHFHAGHWRPLLERAGLMDGGEVFHFHALRHFASSWWIANGMDLPTVATLMGHSKFDMTLQVYAHPVMAVSRHSDEMGRMATRLLAADDARTAASSLGASENLRMGRDLIVTI